MGKYFGTDGIRGRVNETVTAERAYRVGRFIARYYGQKKGTEKPKTLIGKDTRESGDMLVCAFLAGLTAAGGDGYLLGVATTPCVAHLTRLKSFDCGVVISASHNPYTDNGIKIFNGRGEKPDEEFVSLCERALDGRSDDFDAAAEKVGKVIDRKEGRRNYLSYLLTTREYDFRGKRIALDCAFGAASETAREAFEQAGAVVFAINDRPDGRNINRDCGSTHPDGLRKLVAQKGLDMGFAYDGDGDRCLCVDEKGNILTGDHILYLCGRFEKSQGTLAKNTVVGTVMSNFGLRLALERSGIYFSETAVGDKSVYDEMKKNGYTLGGEPSGHIVFSRYATTGDGILTSLRIADIAMKTQKPLSELSALPLVPQCLASVVVKNKAVAVSDKRVRALERKYAEKIGAGGRVLVRASGTESSVRVMAQAPEQALCLECVERIRKAVLAADEKS